MTQNSPCMKRILSCAIVYFTAVINQVSAQSLEGVNPDHLSVLSIRFSPPVIKKVELPGGIQLEYAEQGNTAGTPVIFLHGYTDSWHSFETVLSYLPDNIHAFVPSQRGHGNSSKLGISYHPKNFAADVAAFMKVKGLAKAIIVGHSMGGIIAQQFALDYPELAKGIVLIGTDASFKDNPGLPEFTQEILKLSDPVPYEFANEFQKGTCAKPIDAGYYKILVNESLKVPAHIWKDVMNGIMDVDYRNQLYRITQPALIVWGDKDGICSKNDQDILIKGISNGRLLVYQETGHALHWEEPERFATDLVDFIVEISTQKNEENK